MNIGRNTAITGDMLLDNPAKSQYIRRNMIQTTIEQPISSLINAKWLVETNGFKGRFRRYW